MTYAAKTSEEQYTIRNKLIQALRAVELSLTVNNPALDADLEVLLAAVAASMGATVGSGVSTTALVPSGVFITCTCSGTYSTKFTPTVVNGVVTGIVLS
jgi:hypothetical protein